MAILGNEQLVNGPSTTLNGAITNVATSLVVTSATGFPASGRFRLKIESEILIVTGVSGTTFTVVRGAEGTSGAAHADLTPVACVLTKAALVEWQPPYDWQPRQINLLGWTYDPVMNSTGIVLTSGVLNLAKIYLPRDVTITNIHVEIQAAGITLTSAQNFAGLYDSSGTSLRNTADQSAVWNTTGYKTMALTTPLAVSGGEDVWIYVAMLGNGATAPSVRRGSDRFFGNNGQLAAADGFRFGTVLTGQTTLPGSITIANMASAGSFWFGLS